MLKLVSSVARPHIVAIGALGTLTFSRVLTGERDGVLAACAGVDWFVVNLLNRAVDVREDQANQVTGADVVARHRKAVIVAGVVVLLLSLVVGAWLNPLTVPVRLAFHALGFAYNWPLFPGRRRIKELPFWKNTASATGFLLLCFILPLVTYPRADDITVAAVVVLAVYFFLFELSYEVLYDLRDVVGDRAAGIPTWPVLLGLRGGAAVAVGLMVMSFVVIVGGYVAGVVPWRAAIMGAAPILQLALVARALPTAVTSSLCVGLTWFGALLLGGYHAWELLGLPAD